MFNAEKPYNNLPLLPPALKNLSQEVILKTGDARAALAELKGAIETIPNSSVLINNIPLLEAKVSSEIENIVTTQDKLFKYSALRKTADDADPATKEAFRYRTALRKAIYRNHSIDTVMINNICSIIKNTQMELRDKRVRIGNSYETVYTPPNNLQTIKLLVNNWVEFTENADFDPLVQMAILHYQFEAIHPFEDGNGRTGRVLNLLFLIQKKLLDKPVLYLSRYILENRSQYYDLLRKVTEEEAWEDWILYMLTAVEQTSIWTLQHIQSIKELMTHTKQYLIKSKVNPRYIGLMMDILFTYPYCRSVNLQDLGIKSLITCRSELRKLVDLGILTEEKFGKELVFIHNKYLNLLMDPSHHFEEYK